YFTKIGGNFRESATRASLGNVTQNTFRIAIAKTLAQLGPDAAAAVKGLQKALKDDSAAVRAQVALALGSLGSAAAEAVPDMLQAAILEDNPTGVEQGIAKIGKDAVPALIKALNNTNMKIQLTAIRTLGRIGPPAQAAIPQLTRFARGVGVNPELVKPAEDALKQVKGSS